MNVYRGVWKIVEKGEVVSYVVSESYSNKITSSFDKMDNCSVYLVDKSKDLTNIVHNIIILISKFYKVRGKNSFNLVIKTNNNEKLELEGINNNSEVYDRVFMNKNYTKKLVDEL